MLLPSDGYYSNFTHVEIGRYFPELGRLTRITKNGEPVLIPWSDIYKFSEKYDDLGIYHSIRHYNPDDGGIKGPALAPLHFDIDNKEDQARALKDTFLITKHLIEDVHVPYDAVNVYFSGMKGFHVLVDPVAIRLNLVHENSAAIFRFIAEQFTEELDLESIDYAVYDARRIWRLAGSRHQKTGLYKIPCREMVLNGESMETIVKAAERKPNYEELQEIYQPFAYVPAMYFSNIVADYESIKKGREEDKLSAFLSHGASKKRGEIDVIRQFTPGTLRKGCPAVDAIIQKAESTGHLEHYERLFLCSLLTYTQESIKYLHMIFSKLSDYSFEISELHIRDWIGRRDRGIGGRPYTCEKSKLMGIICNGCEELQPKSYETSYGEEYVAGPSPIRFAYKYHEGEGK